jgi:hypothetical protein
MLDWILVLSLASAFAVTVTAHVAIVASLARRTPRWRAPLALLIPVLAPIWAFAEGMRVRATLWCAGLLVYAAALAVALAH